MHHAEKSYYPSIMLGALLLALGAFVAYGYTHLSSRITELEGLVATTTSANTQKLVELSDTLYNNEQHVAEIQDRLGGFEETVGDISGTVGDLEKLSKTDPELLQKYSKVFFLNEHYAPERLTQIDPKYVYSETRAEKISTPVWSHLKDLFEDAKDDGVEIFAASAYRSFDEQQALKGSYTVTYGAGTANQFSADQGYSEHQLGTTLDFITKGMGGALTTSFEVTPAFAWLQKNAYKYGFVLSYPKGNAYYIYEPWHWRYVGEKLAAYLHRNDKNFYDLEQRDIDKYLIDIFD